MLSHNEAHGKGAYEIPPIYCQGHPEGTSAVEPDRSAEPEPVGGRRRAQIRLQRPQRLDPEHPGRSARSRSVLGIGIGIGIGTMSTPADRMVDAPMAAQLAEFAPAPM
ncbi:hypothetical protein [Streptomyces sp. NBC_01718]|uniref:hypothetical protein n=1 Tax=Streptomyces sp. NBC_01718 TaxID=2975919 RepID=UPI00352F7B56